jgi:hypothetical protein
MTTSLQQWIDREHEWQLIFNKSYRKLDLNNAEDRQTIADKIDTELSPENLHCDGEISTTEANRKYVMLTRCARQLLAIDPTVKFYEYSE